MKKTEHQGYYIFYDDQGNAVGVGERTRVEETIDGVAGASTAFTITSANGASTDNFDEIDKATRDNILADSKQLKKYKGKPVQ